MIIKILTHTHKKKQDDVKDLLKGKPLGDVLILWDKIGKLRNTGKMQKKKRKKKKAKKHHNHHHGANAVSTSGMPPPATGMPYSPQPPAPAYYSAPAAAAPAQPHQQPHSSGVLGAVGKTAAKEGVKSALGWLF